MVCKGLELQQGHGWVLWGSLLATNLLLTHLSTFKKLIFNYFFFLKPDPKWVEVEGSFPLNIRGVCLLKHLLDFHLFMTVIK